MTKVTYIGNQPTKESKHIELVQVYADNSQSEYTSANWEFCQLIKRNVGGNLDLILCYDESTGNDMMFLGNWNDGTTSNKHTICTVLGEDVVKPKGKGIELLKILYTDLTGQEIRNSFDGTNPREFKNVEVVRYGLLDKLDIFYCYDTDRTKGAIFLGHLNDGFVE